MSSNDILTSVLRKVIKTRKRDIVIDFIDELMAQHDIKIYELQRYASNTERTPT